MIRSSVHALAAIVVVCAAACSDSDGGPTPPNGGVSIPADVFTISEPIPASTLPSAGLALSSPRAAIELVYVSASPGQLSIGGRVAITNMRTSVSATAPIVDGGFDPIALPAVLGDVLKVIVTNTSGGTSESSLVVNPGRPPRVVRTNPPKGRTDVPINRTMVVVFSEPVAPSSVNETSIRVDQAGTAVPGSVRMLPGDDVTGEFVPSSTLRPATTYTLFVAQAITDLAGNALESAVTVQFTTGASSAPEPVASMTILPDSTSTEPGESLTYALLARDARNQFVTMPAGSVSWVSSDPSVVAVGDDGTWRALGGGVATVRAVSGRVEARAKVVVAPAPSIDYTAVVAGTTHACALDANGTAYCWGANDYGQLGNAIVESEPHPSPSRVRIPVSLVSLTAGGQHTCGLTAGGEAWCWGASTEAIGSREGSVRCAPIISGHVADFLGCTPTPVRVSSPIRFKQLVGTGTLFAYDPDYGIGSLFDATTCGLTLDGQPYCWGSADDGIIGIGMPGGGNLGSITPVPTPTTARFTSLAGGGEHVCGVTVAGEVYCWGANLGGELGIGNSLCFTGSANSQPCLQVPRRVDAAPALSVLTAGLGFTCGLTSGGATWCWGGGKAINSAPGSRSVPALVPDRPVFTALSGGPTAMHICGIDRDGHAKCWGRTAYVSLTPGVPPPPLTVVPADVADALRFRQIAAGAAHGCGVSVGGAVYCWGSNDHGQLGRDGPDSRTAVRVNLP